MEGSTLSTLTHSFQHDIVNVDTQRILELMYTNSDYPARRDWQWRTWTEAATPNWFHALLGTDNCKGTVFLLTQHATEAGKREITEIRTWWDGDWPYIWYVLSSYEWTSCSSYRSGMVLELTTVSKVEGREWLANPPGRMIIKPADDLMDIDGWYDLKPRTKAIEYNERLDFQSQSSSILYAALSAWVCWKVRHGLQMSSK